jgi:WD40 repeat protein
MSKRLKAMQWEYDKTNFDRNLAVVIGIDRYKSKSIQNLKTPVSDARALADLLETEYGYEPENVVRLFNEAATLTGLQTLLDDTLPNQLKPTKSDRLIFYFAGHGIPRNGQDGPEGYLVPQDADSQKQDSFLPMSKVYEALSKLECHHLLVILDCCFAGTFRWAGRREMILILETVRREHYDRFIRYPAWQVMTSAAHDQEALDVAKLAEDKRGAVADEKQELHSPFALALLEGLRENKADLIQDGVITAHELYLYLEQRVSQLSRERQRPGIYPMRLEYDRGEFVFTRPGFTSEQLKPAPLLNESNNPYRGLASFDEKHAHFFFGRKVLVEELQRRLSQPNRSLTVVLGASGSGKSSLVKAGLIPDLRQESKWYILDPMRPDRSPFTALARAILPIKKPELIEQLSQVSFLDEVFKPKDESGQDKGDEPTDAAFVKLAESWNSAKPEAQLLLVEDYFEQLQALCRNPQEKEQLSQLYRAIFEQLESLRNRLQNEPQHLTHVIKKWSEAHPDAKLLLTIDQFEELITMSQESPTETHGGDRQEGDSPNETVGERAAEPQPWLPFLQVLREAIVECPQQLHIVLTLRSDFEPRFLSSPLSAYWKDARFPVRAMNLDELRQAIEGPALKQALYFEPPELVGKLIDEVGQMPGALPLLSFTLSELYIKLHERWAKDNASDRALRIKDYEELGGVAGALTRRATEEYDNLVRNFGEASGKAYQATMRRVMLRMVTIEGGGVARRRVPESELVYPDAEENKRVAQVSDRLVKARLLVKGQETGEPYVEPAHDFLVRGWDKLQGWIKEEQGNLTLQQRLTPAASDWNKNNRDTEYLWLRDPRLALLEKVIESKRNNWLNQLELEFVEISKQKRLDELEETKRQLQISEERRVKAELREKATRVEKLLKQQPLNALVLAIHSIGLNLDKLPKDTIDLVQTRLLQVAETVRIQNAFTGHTGDVNSIAFSPNGQMIVSGSDDGTIRLWDIQGNPISQPFTVHNAAVNCVAFSPDGQMIVSGSDDGTIRLWDIQGNPISQPLTVHNTAVNCVAFSPDGQMIISGSNDKTVRLWDIRGNLIGQPFIGHTDIVNSVAFSPDGQMIVSGSNDKTVRLWDIQGNGNPIGQPFTGHKAAVNSVAFSPNGQMIASGSDDKTVRLWKRRRNVYSLELTLTGHTDVVSCVAFSPDGQTIATGGRDYTIHLWDSQGNLIRQPLHGHRGHIRSVAFSPNSQMIASASDDRTVHLWDNQNSSLIEQISLEHQETITSVAFSPNGQMIVSGSNDKTVRLWDIRGNLIGQPFIGHTDIVNSVAFSPNGQMIVSGSNDITVRLWDIRGNLIGQPFIGHNTAVNSVAFSPDSQMIASGEGWRTDGTSLFSYTLRLWDLQGNPIGQPFTGHSNAVTSVAFSPNGQMIVSGSDDRTVRLWDIQGNPIGQPYRGHKRGVNSVAFSPDSQIIASGGNDNTIYLWQGSWQAWLATCCNRLRYHPIFKNPQTEIEKSACKTCQKYVWNLRTDELNKQGAAKLKEKVFLTALEHFNQAIQLNPKYTAAYYNRGITNMNLILYHKAIEDFDQVVRAIPDHAAAYEYRGICQAKRGDKQLAKIDWQKAIALYQKQERNEKHQSVLIMLNHLC